VKNSIPKETTAESNKILTKRSSNCSNTNFHKGFYGY